MRRLAFAVSLLLLVAVVLGAFTAGSTQRAGARQATPDSLLHHPVVGAWRLDTDINDPANQPSSAIFHADGTYLEHHPTVGLGIGVWEPTGERTADLTIIFADLVPTEDGFTQAATTVRAAVEVDEGGNTLTAPYTFAVGPPDGVVYEGMLTAAGVRLAVEPMVPLGTPLAGTPVP